MDPFVGVKAFYRGSKRFNVVRMPHVSGIQDDQFIHQAQFEQQSVAASERRLNFLTICPQRNDFDSVAGSSASCSRQVLRHVASDAENGFGSPQNQAVNLFEKSDRKST